MTRWIHLVVAVLVAMSLSACRYVSPDPGTEAVLVEKPWLFGHGGVVRDTVKTGAAIQWLSTEAYHVSTKATTIAVNFNDLMTKDGVPLDFDAGVTYVVKDPVCMVEKSSVAVFQRSKEEGSWPVWFWDNLFKPTEAAIRDAVKQHGLNEAAIESTATAQINAEVTAAIQTALAKSKVAGCVDVTGFNVGRANPPDSVKDQRIATAAQQQRIQTEQQGKLAEDQRRAHEASRAAADNAYREALNLSPSQFIALEQVKAIRDACANGKCTIINGSVPVVVGQ